VDFTSFGPLLLPADPEVPGAILHSERWSVAELARTDADVVVWVAGPLADGTGPWPAARRAAAREMAIVRLRATRGRLAFLRLHRLPPPVHRAGRVRTWARSALLGGAAVELAGQGPSVRVIDAVADAAGAYGIDRPLHAGSGGAVVVAVDLPGGSAILRAACQSLGDPRAGAKALQALEATGSDLPPRLLASGETAGAGWTLETRLPGRRPAVLSTAVRTALADFLATLPRVADPPSAPGRDLDAVGETFGLGREVLQDLRVRLEPALDSLPGVARHGDLWAGNVLVRGDRLTGVIDWDAWAPDATPGEDLVHLLWAERASRTGRSLGEFLETRGWLELESWPPARRYWETLGISVNRPILRAVSVAWWAGQIATNLRRLPQLASDRQWVRRNVAVVVGPGRREKPER